MLFPEANNWRAGMQDVSAGIDDTMAELVTVTPARTKPNYPSEPEPERAVQVVAVFLSPHRTVSIDRHSGRDRPIDISTSKPSFSFGRCVLPFELQQGYRVELCRTGETFEVKDVQPDGVARTVATVVQLGRQLASR